MMPRNIPSAGPPNSIRDLGKRQFLHDELFSMTLMATVQRGHVYAESSPATDRIAFQNDLRRKLTEIAVGYKTSRTDAEHEQNIVDLATSLSAAHKSALWRGRFRIGSAQKALNLFLKYLWCLGEVGTPPHCPFDYRIIQMLPPAVRCNWTALDTIDGYRGLVAAARVLAGKRPLAEWELAAYNESQPSR
jgi:hypothetical protein